MAHGAALRELRHVHARRVRGTPVEIAETQTPLLFWRKEFRPDSGGAGRTLRIWSAPTPKCRSAKKRYCAVDRFKGARVSSSTTKSLPAPCILVKRIRMQALSAGLGGRV